MNLRPSHQAQLKQLADAMAAELQCYAIENKLATSRRETQSLISEYQRLVESINQALAPYQVNP